MAKSSTSFQKGNELWRRHNPCRPPMYNSPDEIWEQAKGYFQWASDNPLISLEIYGKDATECEIPKMRALTQVGLLNYMGISKTTWFNYGKNPVFSNLIAHIEQIIYQQKFEGAAAGLLNPNIIARDLGLVDKKELKTEDTQKVVFYTPDNGRAISQKAEEQENTHDIPYEDLTVKLDKRLDLPPLNSGNSAL